MRVKMQLIIESYLAIPQTTADYISSGNEILAVVHKIIQ